MPYRQQPTDVSTYIFVIHLHVNDIHTQYIILLRHGVGIKLATLGAESVSLHTAPIGKNLRILISMNMKILYTMMSLNLITFSIGAHPQLHINKSLYKCRSNQQSEADRHQIIVAKILRDQT